MAETRQVCPPLLPRLMCLLRILIWKIDGDMHCTAFLVSALSPWYLKKTCQRFYHTMQPSSA